MHTAEPINDDKAKKLERVGTDDNRVFPGSVPTGPNAKPPHEVRFRDNELLMRAWHKRHVMEVHKIPLAVHRRACSACGQHRPLVPKQSPRTK